MPQLFVLSCLDLATCSWRGLLMVSQAGRDLLHPSPCALICCSINVLWDLWFGCSKSSNPPFVSHSPLCSTPMALAPEIAPECRLIVLDTEHQPQHCPIATAWQGWLPGVGMRSSGEQLPSRPISQSLLYLAVGRILLVAKLVCALV